jgi:naphthalene 1,2-dioxygenase ferredoxin component
MNDNEQWQDLISIKDLREGWVTMAELESHKLAIYDTPTGIFVSQANCSHAGANLCHGYFEGHTIECPWHQGTFDVRTGHPKGAPATRDIKIFPSRIEKGMIQIRVKPVKS